MSPRGLESKPNCTRIAHEQARPFWLCCADSEIVSVYKPLQLNDKAAKGISQLDGFKWTGIISGKRSDK